MLRKYPGGGLSNFAEREFSFVHNPNRKSDDESLDLYANSVVRNTLDLVKLFGMQGHSGMSAGIVR